MPNRKKPPAWTPPVETAGEPFTADGNGGTRRLNVADLNNPDIPITVRWQQVIGDEPLPKLKPGLRRSLCIAVGIKLDDRECDAIRGLAQGFAEERFALAKSVSFGALERSLASIERASRDLLEAIEIYDDVDLASWEYLRAARSEPFERDNVYPVITQIVARAHQARKDAARAGGIAVHTDRALFSRLVIGLADLFASRSLPVTASKPGSETSQQSQFVTLVWTVMRAVPDKLQMHTHSEGAMSEAVSKALREWKKRRGIPGRKPRQKD